MQPHQEGVLDVLQKHVPLRHDVFLLSNRKSRLLENSCTLMCVPAECVSARVTHLLLLEDGLFLQDFDCVELVICLMVCEQHLAKAALANHFEEVEVTGFSRRVRGGAQVDLLGWTGL